jgi:hypothetical protein
VLVLAFLPYWETHHFDAEKRIEERPILLLHYRAYGLIELYFVHVGFPGDADIVFGSDEQSSWLSWSLLLAPCFFEFQISGGRWKIKGRNQESSRFRFWWTRKIKEPNETAFVKQQKSAHKICLRKIKRTVAIVLVSKTASVVGPTLELDPTIVSIYPTEIQRLSSWSNCLLQHGSARTVSSQRR